MLTTDQTVLVVVDIQGNLYQVMDEKQALLQNSRLLIKGITTLEIPVLLTEQNKIGTTIPDIQDLLPDVTPFKKDSFSCCQEESFMAALAALNRKQVVLAGTEAHICVYQTALDLMARGYQVALVIDAIASRTAQNKRIAVQRLISAGVLPTSTEMVLFELLKTAANPKARDIFKMVK